MRLSTVSAVGFMMFGICDFALSQAAPGQEPGVKVIAGPCWEMTERQYRPGEEKAPHGSSNTTGKLKSLGAEIDGDVFATDSALFSNAHIALAAVGLTTETWKKKLTTTEVGEVEVSGVIKIRATVHLTNPECAASAVGSLHVLVKADGDEIVNATASVALNLQTTSVTVGTVSLPPGHQVVSVQIPGPSQGQGSTPQEDLKAFDGYKCNVRRVFIACESKASMSADAWGWPWDSASAKAELNGETHGVCSLLCLTACPPSGSGH